MAIQVYRFTVLARVPHTCFICDKLYFQCEFETANQPGFEPGSTGPRAAFQLHSIWPKENCLPSPFKIAALAISVLMPTWLFGVNFFEKLMKLFLRIFFFFATNGFSVPQWLAKIEKKSVSQSFSKDWIISWASLSYCDVTKHCISECVALDQLCYLEQFFSINYHYYIK